MDNNDLINKMGIVDFKNEKLEAYINHTLKSPVLNSLDPERFTEVKIVIIDAFQGGFDFGLDASERFIQPSHQPDWFKEPDKLLDLVEGMLSRIGKIRYPDEGQPTPEQKAEYELEERRHRISNLTLRLIEMPHLYGDYLPRNETIKMAMSDACLWDDMIKKAVK